MNDSLVYRCTDCGYREIGRPEWNWSCPKCSSDEDSISGIECPHGCAEMVEPVNGDPLEPDGPYCPECGHIHGIMGPKDCDICSERVSHTDRGDSDLKTLRMSNSPDKGPIECIKIAWRRLKEKWV